MRQRTLLRAIKVSTTAAICLGNVVPAGEMPGPGFSSSSIRYASGFSELEISEILWLFCELGGEYGFSGMKDSTGLIEGETVRNRNCVDSQ